MHNKQDKVRGLLPWLPQCLTHNKMAFIGSSSSLRGAGMVSNRPHKQGLWCSMKREWGDWRAATQLREDQNLRRNFHSSKQPWKMHKRTLAHTEEDGQQRPKSYPPATDTSAVLQSPTHTLLQQVLRTDPPTWNAFILLWRQTQTHDCEHRHRS